MENNNEFEFNFNFDEKYEDIIAKSKMNQDDEYEDIVSDSSKSGETLTFEDISSTSKKGFKEWWKNLTKAKKTLLISATSIVLVLALVLVWFFSYFKYNYNSITTDPNDLGFTGIKEKGVINIALFGVDSRNETVFKGNTDSIMILSLNTNTKKVKIFSIMRDTLVPMEYKGEKYFGKINSAYSKGPEHAIKTINQTFDLDISEYATVNFYGMTDIIDAVGGINATITADELTWKGNDHPNLNNCMDEICREMGLKASEYYIHTAGEQVLNGVQAVAYARVRHCTTAWGTRDDFGRTDRQRHVMQELFNKAIAMKKTQYVSLAKALIPCSETSLSYTDIMGLATNILLSSPTFEQYRLPPSEYQRELLMQGPTGYGSIIYYDINYAAKMINAIIYDDVNMAQYIEANPIEKNNWYYEMTGSTSKKPSSTTTASKPSTQNTVEPTTSQAPAVSSKVESVTSVSSTSSKTEITSNEQTTTSEQETSSKQNVSVQQSVSSKQETSSKQESSSKQETTSEQETSSKQSVSSEGTQSDETVSSEQDQTASNENSVEQGTTDDETDVSGADGTEQEPTDQETPSEDDTVTTPEN